MLRRIEKAVSLRAGAAVAAMSLLCGGAVLTGCDKGGDTAQAPVPPPPTSTGTGGMPAQTPEQKQAEDAARAQSASSRAEHMPPAPK